MTENTKIIFAVGIIFGIAFGVVLSTLVQRATFDLSVIEENNYSKFAEDIMSWYNSSDERK